MKKSIKYAGIAAATLLAVAPVAAPVVSSTTAQAATVQDDQGKQDAAVTAFGAQFKDQLASNFVKDGALVGVSLGSTNATDFATKNATLVNSGSEVTADQMALLNSKGTATATVSATYGNSTVKDNADLLKVLSDTTYPEVVFTITLNFNNMNGVAQTKTFTEKATRPSDTTSAMTTANATFTTPLNVALNSTTTATVLNASNDAAIKDQNGNSVLTKNDNVTVGTGFYDTYSAAINSIGNGNQNQTAATNVGSDADVNDGQTSFLKAGTYYQVIKFTAGNDETTSALKAFLDAYYSNPSSYAVYVNGKKASAGYDFVQSADGNTVSFVRAINVSNTTSDWSVSSVDGVVTTKSDSAYYTLKNNDNVTVKNRALAANTAWKADKVRTDQFGNKQYRVATGEWIDADNVTFGETATDNNNNSASGLTDVQSVKGVVSVGTPGFTYLLYSKDGKLIKNRALAGGTDWKFINTAKDSDGTTYYRVATDEWVAAGNGVTVK